MFCARNDRVERHDSFPADTTGHAQPSAKKWINAVNPSTAIGAVCQEPSRETFKDANLDNSLLWFRREYLSSEKRTPYHGNSDPSVTK
jgi:hypothetical protein